MCQNSEFTKSKRLLQVFTSDCRLVRAVANSDSSNSIASGYQGVEGAHSHGPESASASTDYSGSSTASPQKEVLDFRESILPGWFRGLNDDELVSLHKGKKKVSSSGTDQSHEGGKNSLSRATGFSLFLDNALLFPSKLTSSIRSSGVSVLSISAGSHHVVFVTGTQGGIHRNSNTTDATNATGTRIFAFGNNTYGQCGISETTGEIISPVEVKIAAIDERLTEDPRGTGIAGSSAVPGSVFDATGDQRRGEVVKLCCGFAHSLVLLRDGSVWGKRLKNNCDGI